MFKVKLLFKKKHRFKPTFIFARDSLPGSRSYAVARLPTERICMVYRHNTEVLQVQTQDRAMQRILANGSSYFVTDRLANIVRSLSLIRP